MENIILFVTLLEISFLIGYLYLAARQLFTMNNEKDWNISAIEWKIRFLFGALIMRIFIDIIAIKLSTNLLVILLILFITLIELGVNKRE